MKPDLLAITLLTAAALAMTSATGSSSAGPQEQWSSSADAPSVPGTPNTVRGTVLGASQGRLIINSAGSFDQLTVGVSAQTKLTLDGKPTSLEHLKSGDLVNVTFEGRDREWTATVITAWSPM